MGNNVSIVDLHINQGDDFDVVFKLNGLTSKASDYRFKFGARHCYGVNKLDIERTCEILDDMTIRLLLTRDVTSNLQAVSDNVTLNKFYYDIQMINDEVAQRVVQGKLFISAGNAFLGGD